MGKTRRKTKIHHIHRHVKKIVKRGLKKLRGFTLIELLIVIAVVGIIAAIIIAVINPLDKIAKAKDASKQSSIRRIGRALEAYDVLNGSYPAPGNVEAALKGDGGLKSIPTNPSGTTVNCTSTDGQGAVNINGFCYNVSTSGSSPFGAIVYVPMESSSEMQKCATGATWYAWSGLVGGTGETCTSDTSTEPPVVITQFVTESSPGSTDTTPTPTPTISIFLPTDTPTTAPIATPTSTPIPAPPTATPIPTNTPTIGPPTCSSIGGVCKSACKGNQTSQGQMDCSTGSICCK